MAHGDPSIIVLGGGETGQELLDEAVRVLDPTCSGGPCARVPRSFVERRRKTDDGVVSEAGAALRTAR